MQSNYDINEGVLYLRSKDPVIDGICDFLPPLRHKLRNPTFEGMTKIIVSQQLSGAAADTILGGIQLQGLDTSEVEEYWAHVYANKKGSGIVEKHSESAASSSVDVHENRRARRRARHAQRSHIKFEDDAGESSSKETVDKMDSS